jgi:hypothetical protein
MSSDSGSFDPAKIRQALNLAGEDIRGHRVLGEIMIHAGRAILLRYSWSDDGSRIETDISLDGKEGLVRRALEKSGRVVGLPIEWLQDLLPRLCSDGSGLFPTGMYPSWERPGLRVVVAQPNLILAMVFLATLQPTAELSFDEIEPAVWIATQAGVRTPERLRSLISPYVERTIEPEYELAQMVERRLSQFEAAFEHFGYGTTPNTPQSFAEVADLLREDRDAFPGGFHRMVSELAGEYYRSRDEASRQVMLDPVPMPTGDAEIDAWIGASGEHLAQRWGLKVPGWAAEAAFMGGARPRFYPFNPVARGIQIVETPPAFRRRLLFTDAEPLMNARLPHDRKVRMPFWS